MNQSSLFPFEESSDWDPKAIVKHLIVPQDVLDKLNSIPGWTKVQKNQNTLRLGTDFSIVSSQSENPANSSLNSLRIEKNTKLFDEGTENRKSTLEIYKGYKQNLTRSLSFFNINKSCGNSCSSKTLKRSLSLQSVCQLSDTPSDHSVSQKSEAILSNKTLMVMEQNMETIVELAVVDTSTPTENTMEHAGVSDENNALLAAKNSEIAKENDVLHVKKANLHSEVTKESNGILHTNNVDLQTVTTKESNSVFSENVALESNNISGIEYESANVNNGDLHSGTANENNYVDIVDLHSETAKEYVANVDLHFETAKQNVDSHSETAKENADNVELYSETMKENVDIHSETAKESVDEIDLHSETAKENVDKVDLHSETAKESVELHSETTKENVDNVDSETTKGNNEVLLVANNAPCSNKVSDEPAEAAIKDSENIDNFIRSSVSKIAESEIPTPVDVSDNEIAMISHGYEEKTMETTSSNHPTIDADADKIVRDSEPPAIVECFVSSLTSGEKTASKNIAMVSVKESIVIKLSPNESPAMEVPAKELLLPQKEAESTYSVSDMKVNAVENDEKGSGKTCDPSKSSSNDETSVSKKRKLEPRNKRSKRRRSEEKHGNLKVRSIKKVSEICYSAEEVKTMLDIMKQLL